MTPLMPIPKYSDVVADVAVEKTGSYPNAYDVINVTRRALARSDRVDQGMLNQYFDEACDLYASAKDASDQGDERQRKLYALRTVVEHARTWCFVAIPLEWQKQIGLN